MTTPESNGENSNNEHPPDPGVLTEGYLLYKAPGIFKGSIYRKRYFWLEVPFASANPPENAESGVLYFTKSPGSQNQAPWKIKISEISEIMLNGIDGFSFKLKNDHHVFRADDTQTRDGWVAALASAISSNGEGPANRASGPEYHEVEHETRPASKQSGRRIKSWCGLPAK